MDIDQFIKLTTAIVSLIQALAWPLIVLFLMFYFGSPLKKFLGDIGEFTFKAGATGLEASAKRQEVAANLGAADASRTLSADGEKKITDEDKARGIAKVVDQAFKPRNVRRLSEASVLWVDDNPSNNTYERRALEALGIHFTISTSTDDALQKIRSNKYDAIISDMGRPADKRAGYTLLDALKRELKDNMPPFIIYSMGGHLASNKGEAVRAGAFGSTDEPQELFQFVVNAITEN